jgi:hypothetical protein
MPASMVMQELILNHAEFLALLEEVQAHQVVGIKKEDLFPADEHERQELLEQGRAALHQRGALAAHQETGKLTLTPAFERLAQTVAYPKLANIIVREVLGLGPQLFLHYLAEGVFVEHTYPQEKVHRLAVLPDMQSLIERARFILSLIDEPIHEAAVEISEDTLQNLQTLVNTGQYEQARRLLTEHRMVQEDAEALCQTLMHMAFKGRATLMSYNDKVITDVRGIVIWQGQGGTWGMVQRNPEVPMVSIQTTNAANVKYWLSQYFEELGRPFQQ